MRWCLRLHRPSAGKQWRRKEEKRGERWHYNHEFIVGDTQSSRPLRVLALALLSLLWSWFITSLHTCLSVTPSPLSCYFSPLPWMLLTVMLFICYLFNRTWAPWGIDFACVLYISSSVPGGVLSQKKKQSKWVNEWVSKWNPGKQSCQFLQVQDKTAPTLKWFLPWPRSIFLHSVYLSLTIFVTCLLSAFSNQNANSISKRSTFCLN
jgi:hypothetical protein